MLNWNKFTVYILRACLITWMGEYVYGGIGCNNAIVFGDSRGMAPYYPTAFIYNLRHIARVHLQNGESLKWDFVRKQWVTIDDKLKNCTVFHMPDGSLLFV